MPHTKTRRKTWVLLFALVLGVVLANPAVRAQATTCHTANCAQGDPPPLACRNRATPSTLQVDMTTDANFLFVYVPAEPKIEPGDCIEWIDRSDIHNSSGDPCPDDPNFPMTSCPCSSSCGNFCQCSAPSTCNWDTGDVSADPAPSAVCYYDPSVGHFPAGTNDGYYCRRHDNPSHTGTMHGTLHVTSLIQIMRPTKGPTNVAFTWSGDGTTGDLYRVVSNTVPSFPRLSNQTSIPGTTKSINIPLSDPHTFFLIRNKQNPDQ